MISWRFFFLFNCWLKDWFSFCFFDNIIDDRLNFSFDWHGNRGLLKVGQLLKIGQHSHHVKRR
jgi:hypothetical protein